MPIRIEHGPVGDLLALAQAAGAGAARQRQEAGDLAYTQMVMEQQARYAETAARLQASDRAFALQRAALERKARTPTKAAAISGPIASEMIRAQRQQAQLEQLETVYAVGGMSAADLERAKLEIMAGREVVAPTKVLKAPVTKLSATAKAIRSAERRNQRSIQRKIVAEERKLEIDPYADPEPQRIRAEEAKAKLVKYEAELETSYQREDIATGAARGPSIPGEKLSPSIERPGAAPISKRLTSAEEDAIMDMYIAETKGDIEAAKRLWAERTGR